MNRNVGSWDRAIRIVAGVVLIALTLMGTIGAWGWIGLIPLATGLIGRCPVYKMLNLSTGSMNRSEA